MKQGAMPNVQLSQKEESTANTDASPSTAATSADTLEKGYYGYVPHGIVSFDQYREYLETQERVDFYDHLVMVYQSLMRNILWENPVPNAEVIDALEALNNQFSAMLRVGALENDDMMMRERSDVPQTWFVKESGTPRWMGVWSNNFQDTQREVLKASAHREYVDYVNKSGDFPELWLWHIPFLPIGQSDFIEFDEQTGMAVASGTFHDEFAFLAKEMADSGQAWQMSHGIPRTLVEYDMFSPTDIDFYRARELTVLPELRAANLLTDFIFE